jgi:GalNAc-alpha-(1->4)-GalNAc-alpha-(1->3)-diNAcBac-PP-undecaprenol alpha-1,4-N-acetyl-D-galactosaminyltransferase
LLNKKNKNLVYYSPYLQNIHITKDGVQIPNAISELRGYKSFIISNNEINEVELKKYAPQVRIIILKKIFANCDIVSGINTFLLRFKLSINRRFEPFNFILFLLLNLRKVDYLYLYNFGTNADFDVVVFGLFYKLFNPEGILHIRIEHSIPNLDKTFPLIDSRGLIPKLKNSLIKLFMKKVSIIGLVDDSNFTAAKSFPYLWEFAQSKLRLQYNGYRLFYDKITDFNERENYITIIGRLYSEEKGLKLLLEALIEIDLRDWKVLLLGEIDDDTLFYIDNFLKNNNHLQGKLEIVGNITDRQLYHEYLNKCKIFCTPFKYDGMSLALVEALSYGIVPVVPSHRGNIISTDNGNAGMLFPLGDIKTITLQLQELINNEEKLMAMSKNAIKFAEENFQWNKIIQSLKI